MLKTEVPIIIYRSPLYVYLENSQGTCVAQLVKPPTWAQVMISRFAGSSPVWGSMLTAQSLEPASDSASLPFSLCPFPAHTLSVSLSLKNE